MANIPPAHKRKFQKKILDFYKNHGREHLPWRKNQAPYVVFVSEFMLQQTQVERVIPLFEKFIAEIPNIEKLARVNQPKLLKLWQGLGYNTRALRLQKAAQGIWKNHAGIIPKEKEHLLTLPGVGPYTAAAIRVFAYNLPDAVLETNIRRVFIHEFFKKKKVVSDNDILPLLHETLPQKNPRQWYEALMDYGATLPKILRQNPNTQSKHYAKQSKFKGSDRELRGKILRLLLSGKTINSKLLGEKTGRIKKIIAGLRKDGFAL